ncbi:MAG TPA: septum site-determining protein MinC [Nevskiaceae bacterium]|nr:septum site-determining protein MinC [Nevskiaceae bacterium]
MPVDSIAVSARHDALSLQGRVLSVTRVRVLTADDRAIAAQLATLAQRMPQAVRGMPVVIDSDVEVDLELLLRALRQVGMQPLGVSAGALAAAAHDVGLAVLPADSGRRPHAPAGPPDPVAQVAPSASTVTAPTHAVERASARVVTEPVRSGQQVQAVGADLVVLNTVSAGAELIADGCIHVYGRLSGRAIAGAHGDETARVFCRRMEAELVAIAGIYAVSEQIKDGPRGAAAQAWLEGGRLRIERLG